MQEDVRTEGIGKLYDKSNTCETDSNGTEYVGAGNVVVSATGETEL
jgi:hypothetical protein